MISVAIPVFDERATFEEILLRVQNVEIPKEIIVIDDASTDATREFLSQINRHAAQGNGTMPLPNTGGELNISNLRVFFQPKNEGRGTALRRGFQEASGQIIIIQDADLEYDPKEHSQLLSPILGGQADVVYGSRFLGGPHRVLFFWHYAGNRLLTFLSYIVTDLNLSDVWTCHKAFKREVLQDMNLEEDGFGLERKSQSNLSKTDAVCTKCPFPVTGAHIPKGKGFLGRTESVACGVWSATV